MLNTYLTDILGSPPSGYEPLVYVAEVIVLVFILSLAYRMILGMFSFMSRGW